MINPDFWALLSHMSSPVSISPTAGYGQHKGTCKGYCASACNKKDEWTFHQSCKKMYCCLPPPKKGK